MGLALDILREIQAAQQARSEVRPKYKRCPKGHPMTHENTYTYANGKTGCAECSRAACRDWYRRNEKRPRRKCMFCDTPINASNRLGACRNHRDKYRYELRKAAKEAA